MKRWLLTTTVALVLCGCAGIPNEEAFKTKVSSWEGHDINEVIGAWGPPKSTFKAPDGNTVYTYEEGQLVASSCTVNFTVNREQKIVGWRYSGTACRTVY